MPATVDLSAYFAALAEDLCRRLPTLRHIDGNKLLFALARSRAEGLHGTYARIAPLRFAGGAVELTRRRGRWRETFRMPALRHEGREILYVIHIMVPRFLRLSPAQKLNTIIHELYHVSERYDGDIRRFTGRNFAHGASRRNFNRKIEELREQYMATGPTGLDALHQLTEESWRLGRLQLVGLSVPLPRARLVDRRQE
jgi:hypothetical protein